VGHCFVIIFIKINRAERYISFDVGSSMFDVQRSSLVVVIPFLTTDADGQTTPPR
jgi:RNase P/RNase MRP subunit POP5